MLFVMEKQGDVYSLLVSDVDFPDLWGQGWLQVPSWGEDGAVWIEHRLRWLL